MRVAERSISEVLQRVKWAGTTRVLCLLGTWWLQMILVVELEGSKLPEDRLCSREVRPVPGNSKSLEDLSRR